MDASDCGNRVELGGVLGVGEGGEDGGEGGDSAVEEELDGAGGLFEGGEAVGEEGVWLGWGEDGRGWLEGLLGLGLLVGGLGVGVEWWRLYCLRLGLDNLGWDDIAFTLFLDD
jgi:hypothetical protein